MTSQSAFESAIDFAETEPALRGTRRAPRASRPFVVKLTRVMRRQTLILTACVLASAAAAFIHLYWTNAFSAPILGAWLATGLGAGIFLAAAREVWREAIDFDVLRRRLKYSVLGAAPELTERTLRQLPPDVRSPLGVLTFQPASPFASAFRDLQEALPNKTVVSFIAPLPDEGATTTALCAAISATQQGRQVVVVDCDLRRRALTQALDIETREGVLEACEDVANWRAFIHEEPETGLHCIPAARTRTAWRSLMGIAGLPLLLEQLRAHYDLIVLDCPPALATAEGPVIARMADRNVVVAVWDETPLSAVRAALRTLRTRTGTHAAAIYVNRAPPGYRPERPRRD